MTKEEMISQYISEFVVNDPISDSNIKRLVLTAIDEYAKQQAIAYNAWYNSIGVLPKAFRSNDELYDQFIESQNKQP